jgi:hypothetical protein
VFEKGRSGNPGGRPRWRSLLIAYRGKLDEQVPRDYKPTKYWNYRPDPVTGELVKHSRMTIAEAVTAELAVMALDTGNPNQLAAIRELSRADPALSHPAVMALPSGDEADRATSDAILKSMLTTYLRRVAVTVEQVPNAALPPRTEDDPKPS